MLVSVNSIDTSFQSATQLCVGSLSCSGKGCEEGLSAFGEKKPGFGEIGQFRTFIEQKEEKAKWVNHCR